LHCDRRERENRKHKSYLAHFLYLTLISSFDPAQAWDEEDTTSERQFEPCRLRERRAEDGCAYKACCWKLVL